MKEKLLTAKAAAEILGVSQPTFRNIQKEKHLNRVKIGARYKYKKSEILEILNNGQLSRSISAQFNVFSSDKVERIEVEKNVFDLRGIQHKSFDPYGVLSLLSEFLFRAKSGAVVKLLVEDNPVCRYLKSINFFGELETRCPGSIEWDKDELRGTRVVLEESLLPVSPVRSHGGHAAMLERLQDILIQQGFNQDVINNFGTIIGELADNAMTHTEQSLSEKLCYFMVNKFFFGDQICTIVGIADLGIGIHNSLQTNEKHKSLSGKQAFLKSFLPFVSAYPDSFGRGKGLTDVSSIAMGNQSHLKVDSCDMSLFMDFRKSKHSILWSEPITEVNGTRFGLIVIDKEFEKVEREEIGKHIKNAIERL